MNTAEGIPFPCEGERMKDTRKFLELEKKIGYEFENFQLLINAMTHSSYANEHHIPYSKKVQR